MSSIICQIFNRESLLATKKMAQTWKIVVQFLPWKLNVPWCTNNQLFAFLFSSPKLICPVMYQQSIICICVQLTPQKPPRQLIASSCHCISSTRVTKLKLISFSTTSWFKNQIWYETTKRNNVNITWFESQFQIRWSQNFRGSLKIQFELDVIWTKLATGVLN